VLHIKNTRAQDVPLQGLLLDSPRGSSDKMHASDNRTPNMRGVMLTWCRLACHSLYSRETLRNIPHLEVVVVRGGGVHLRHETEILA